MSCATSWAIFSLTPQVTLLSFIFAVKTYLGVDCKNLHFACKVFGYFNAEISDRISSKFIDTC
jgi:hypothetical protein